MHAVKSNKNSDTSSTINTNQTNVAGLSLPAVPVLQHRAIQKKQNEDEQEYVPGQPAHIKTASKESSSVVQAKKGHSVIQAKFSTQQLKNHNFAQKNENKTGLPDDLKSGVENLSGFSMDDARVHYNSSRPAQLNAYAYAQGTDIHVGPGNDKHLPHEAWHVVQQKQGRVKSTMQLKAAVDINDDPALEKEADVMGTKSIQLQKQNNLPLVSAPGLTAYPIQLNIVNKLVGNNFSDQVLKWGGSALSTAKHVLKSVNDNVPTYGPLTGRGFGSFMEVTLTNVGDGSSPGVDNETWLALKKRRDSGGDGSRSYYVRGHLFNEKLGGSGGTWQNLTPITQQTNANHANQVESNVKAAVTQHGRVTYRVQPMYGQWPWQWPAYLWTALASPVAKLIPNEAFKALVDIKEAEQHVPVSLECYWWTPVGKSQQVIKQVPNGGTQFRIEVGDEVKDLSTPATLWDLVEKAASLAMKTYLIPIIIPALAELPGASTMEAGLSAMSPAKFIDMIYKISGGKAALVELFISKGWDADLVAASLADGKLQLITDTIAGLFGKNISLATSKEPTRSASTEAFGLFKGMNEDQREDFRAIQDDPRPIADRATRRSNRYDGPFGK